MLTGCDAQTRASVVEGESRSPEGRDSDRQTRRQQVFTSVCPHRQTRDTDISADASAVKLAAEPP